ncbi:MAG: cobalamin-dependent protein, partial [Deltaproteobacteria bacterium]|nr:cobalamin-dependent protein [Deltaproteobacteria bacterium]
MNITFVFPPFYHQSMYNLPPLGLINLASMLEPCVHTVTILDQVLALRSGALPFGRDIYHDSARQILDTEPQLVAFSAQCVTYPPILQIAQRLKEVRPKLKVVVGGHNASFLAKETLERFPQVDMVIRGEGEVTFSELVKALDKGGNLQEVAGLSWRRGAAVLNNSDRPLLSNLDTLPLPDYSKVQSLDFYRQACELPRSIAILEVGRGCPHDCIYCSEAAFWKRRTRTYSVSRIIREMRTLREAHGADCFLLAYDQFTADRSYVEHFCQAVLSASLQTTPWYCISRLDTVDAKLLDLMREAGCESMCYGIDSGSVRTLSFIRKRVDQKILFSRVRETTEVGLVPTLSFVIGFPEEQKDDVDATLFLALACGIQGNSNPLMQLPTVLPGTDLHTKYFKSLTRNVDTYFALGLEFDNGSRLPEDEQMVDSDPEVFSSFWNIFCPALPLTELACLANGFPLIINLFPKTFLLLCKAFMESPADLFLSFVRQVDRTAGHMADMNAAKCFQHFPGFARAKLCGLQNETDWSHLENVLLYECAAIGVAEFAKSEKPVNID